MGNFNGKNSVHEERAVKRFGDFKSFLFLNCNNICYYHCFVINGHCFVVICNAGLFPTNPASTSGKCIREIVTPGIVDFATII